MLLQPLVFLLQPPKPASVVPRASTSRGQLRCDGGLTTRTTPTAGQAIPLLTHTPCYSAATAASHRSEPVNPHTPLRVGMPRLPRLRVVPFLGLTVVHRPGALGVAWSTWSRNDFHQKSVVCGAADSWVHGGRKEVPPYYVQNNYSST